ncbi:MAG: GNAT family N-acetyltransferase [bacterium]|nr:GNAT family N-acetyltransferase [bacterium]MDW8163363.1 GNAT family N-acetyltransferase [Candidatus Omnitrophota bacterium]
MIRKNLENLPEIPTLPYGYKLRIYKEGDEENWCNIINKSCGANFDIEKFISEFKRHPSFSPNRIFFIDYKETSVATSMAWKDSPEEKITGRIHWVGVLEEHRGKGLGYIITLRCLYRLKEEGLKNCYLITQNYRIPAIKMYLKLGFEPEVIDENFNVWKEVFEKLGIMFSL